jgi:hypothetical protein
MAFLFCEAMGRVVSMAFFISSSGRIKRAVESDI